MKEQTKQTGIRVLIAIGIVGASALLSTAFTDPHSQWFMDLAKPAFMPPDMVFGIVWAVVYAWTALSIFWAIQGKSYAILWGYGLTLVLTSLWNFAFFYLNNPGAGTLILVAVLACGAWTARQAFARDTKAGIALLPLVFWSAFALVLNYAIYMSN